MRFATSMNRFAKYLPLEHLRASTRPLAQRIAFRRRQSTTPFFQETNKNPTNPTLSVDEIVNTDNLIPPWLTQNTIEVQQACLEIQDYKFDEPMSGDGGLLDQLIDDSRNIGVFLYKTGSFAAPFWNPRRHDVYPFFSVLLKRTKIPQLNLLSQVLSQSSVAAQFEKEEKRFIETATAVFGTTLTIDDITDSLQDPKVAEIFNNIPKQVDLDAIYNLYERSYDAAKQLKKTLSNSVVEADLAQDLCYQEGLKTLDSLLSFTVSAQQSIFREDLGFFTKSYGLMVEIYNKALVCLMHLGVDKTGLEKIQHEFKKLMDSNMLCLKVNQGQKDLSSNLEIFEENVNIVHCFTTMQLVYSKAIAKKYKDHIPEDVYNLIQSEQFKNETNELSRLADHNFNKINGLETLHQELLQGDLSNPVIGKANYALVKQLQQNGVSGANLLSNYAYRIIPSSAKSFVFPSIESDNGRVMRPFDLFTLLSTNRTSLEREMLAVDTFKEALEEKEALARLDGTHESFSVDSASGDVLYSEFLQKMLTAFQGNEDLKKLHNGRYSGFEEDMTRLGRIRTNNTIFFGAILESLAIPQLVLGDIQQTFNEMETIVDTMKQGTLSEALGPVSDRNTYTLGTIEVSANFADSYIEGWQLGHGLYKMSKGWAVIETEDASGSSFKLTKLDGSTDRVY